MMADTSALSDWSDLPERHSYGYIEHTRFSTASDWRSR
jgi:hypothetical protein